MIRPVLPKVTDMDQGKKASKIPGFMMSVGIRVLNNLKQAKLLSCKLRKCFKKNMNSKCYINNVYKNRQKYC